MSVAVQTMTMTVDTSLDRIPSLTNSLSTTNESEDVSDLRVSFPRALPLQFQNGRKISQSSAAPPARRGLRTSFYMSMRASGLATISSNPRILSCLLNFVSWNDLHSLSGTSRSIRRIFIEASVKDIVLSHFVPGYRTALRLRDRKIWEDVIGMTYGDLGRLMAALDIPPHHYPMHALSVLSSDLPTWEQMATTKRLQKASQTHSRVVLFLQNMVHSTTQPIPSELDDPQWKGGLSTQMSLRELTFPAPLSYFDPNAPKPNNMSVEDSPPPVPSKKDKRNSMLSKKSVSTPPPSRHSRKWGSESAAGATVAPSAYRQDRGAARLSIFGGNANRPPLPPPSLEPASMRFYSGTWRRNNTRSYYASASDDEGVLRPPNRRFVNSRFSSESSLGSAPTQGSSQQATTPTSSSPHDLYAATSRNRAPILRVFVPCSVLSEDVIGACEDQLIEEGLWEHLSVGDIVCNFGYVPPIEETDEDLPHSQEKDHRRWLIFTGDRLLIYYPTLSPPITDALSLPSPFYYSHILPLFVNPRFRLTLPPFKANYSLVRLTTTIQSPHSYNGHARVKAYAWLASLDAHPHPLMSDGWRGEWVLQGEGTREGKLALQEALKGGQAAEREYEVVIDKSGNGKLWLRMIHVAKHSDTDTIDLRTPP